MRRIRVLLPLLLLAGCSAPTDSAGSYPQNPAISDAQGHLRDSTTFYFPAADSLHATYVPKNKRPDSYVIDERVMNCTYELEFASYALTYFDAPVLSNYYLGTDIYRFLWLRSFHRPVLFTLGHNATGAFLRTQLLDKSPGFHILGLLHPDSLPAGTSARKVARVRKHYNETVNSPRFLAEVAEGKRRAAQVKAEETTVTVSPARWQHFQKLLTTNKFYALSACEPTEMVDGAYWLLEAHQADGYHMVFRHSPDEQDGFRKACEYLLDLSSARGEERY